MENPNVRLDDLKSIILNVANKEGGMLNLANLPGSKLAFPEKFLRGVPASFREYDAYHSLVKGFEYFAPGMRVVVLGCKNQVLPYIAAKQVAPGGLVISCFSDKDNLEKFKSKFTGLPRSTEQLAEIQFYLTPSGDLRTRYTEIEKYLENNSVTELKNYLNLDNFISEMKARNPLIEDNSVDITAFDVPNFNTGPENFCNMIPEVYRILKRGGIFLFSLLLSDENALDDGYLCEADMDALTTLYKFHGLQCTGRSQEPFKVVNGKEIRYHNFVAFKGKEGPCLERKQAVIYKGPWREVRDDDGHTYPRGKRVAVCDKTFNILKKPPYKDQFAYINPYIEVPLETAVDFPCSAGILYRDPKVTKGMVDMSPVDQSVCCSTAEDTDGSCCC